MAIPPTPNPLTPGAGGLLKPLSRDNDLALIRSDNVPVVQTAEIACEILNHRGRIAVKDKEKAIAILEELRSGTLIEVELQKAA